MNVFFLFFRNSHHDRKGGVGQCRTCEKITVDGGTHERSSSWAPPLPSFFRDTSPRSYTPSTTRPDNQLSILLSHLPQKTLDKIPRWIKTNMVSNTCSMQIFQNSVASFFRIYGYMGVDTLKYQWPKHSVRPPTMSYIWCKWNMSKYVQVMNMRFSFLCFLLRVFMYCHKTGINMWLNRNHSKAKSLKALVSNLTRLGPSDLWNRICNNRPDARASGRP